MNRVFDNDLYEAFANASENIYVYVTDMETDVTRWSRRAVEYFNLAGEYLRGVKDLWPRYIHPDDREIYLADITAVFEQRSANHNCQYRVQNRYGEYVWVECRGSVIYDNNGMPKVFAGIMTRIDNQNKYDTLTHLLSGYEFFLQRITQSGSLMLIGIDRLRAYNSQHGRHFGSRMILYLAEALHRTAGHAMLFRYWGDDFLVYGSGMPQHQMTAVFKAVQQRCGMAEKEAGLADFSVSAGIVNFAPGDDPAQLVERAEMAMTYAKEQSSTHLAVFSDQLERRQSRRQHIAEALTSSIRNDFRGFRLVYQPIMDSEGACPTGCEALLRWDPQDEKLGPVYPDEFIPILEENGGIVEVGDFVMRESIRQAAAWQTRYPGFRVSFNVSYLQLENPGFIPALLETVRSCALDPACLMVELTESVLASDTVLVREAFGSLQRSGIRVALDDFGRGNSSFWMLHHFQPDYVKLDQAFIRGLDASGEGIDYAIARSTVQLCNSIGCGAVAEGVENEDLLQRLRPFGFSGLQGYLFSRPIPLAELERFLASHRPGPCPRSKPACPETTEKRG